MPPSDPSQYNVFDDFDNINVDNHPAAAPQTPPPQPSPIKAPPVARKRSVARERSVALARTLFPSD